MSLYEILRDFVHFYRPCESSQGVSEARWQCLQGKARRAGKEFMSKTVFDFFMRMEKLNWLRMTVLIGPGAFLTLCVWRFQLGESAALTSAFIAAAGLAAYYSWPRIYGRIAPLAEDVPAMDEEPSQGHLSLSSSQELEYPCEDFSGQRCPVEKTGKKAAARNDVMLGEFNELVQACGGDISEAAARFQAEYEINGNDMVAAIRSAHGRKLRGC